MTLSLAAEVTDEATRLCLEQIIAVLSVLTVGTGAPVRLDQANGTFYFRVDGGAMTTVYQKRAGAWVGVV